MDDVEENLRHLENLLLVNLSEAHDSVPADVLDDASGEKRFPGDEILEESLK